MKNFLVSFIVKSKNVGLLAYNDPWWVSETNGNNCFVTTIIRANEKDQIEKIISANYKGPQDKIKINSICQLNQEYNCFYNKWFKPNYLFNKICRNSLLEFFSDFLKLFPDVSFYGLRRTALSVGFQIGDYGQFLEALNELGFAVY